MPAGGAQLAPSTQVLNLCHLTWTLTMPGGMVSTARTASRPILGRITMTTTARGWGIVVLAGLAVCVIGNQAIAQQNLFTRGNPSPLQVALNMRASNQFAMAAAQINPYTGI